VNSIFLPFRLAGEREREKEGTKGELVRVSVRVYLLIMMSDEWDRERELVWHCG